MVQFDLFRVEVPLHSVSATKKPTLSAEDVGVWATTSRITPALHVDTQPPEPANVGLLLFRRVGYQDPAKKGNGNRQDEIPQDHPQSLQESD